MSMKNSKETTENDICKILNQIGAVQFGAFKLTSGKLSPYYIDLRIVPSFPDAFCRIINYYVKFIKENVGTENFERIAAIPVAGMSFASIIAYTLGKPFLYIRKGERLHGRQRHIEGVLTPGDRVLLIDDLVTTGLSLLRAAKVVTAEGGVIADASVLIDRQEDGKSKLEKSGINLHALLTISDLATKLHEFGTLSDDQLKTILKQIKKK